METFINPIGAYFKFAPDTPNGVKERLKGRGGMCTVRAWKCIDCSTKDGQLYFTFNNVYGYRETIPAKYFTFFRN